MTDDAYRRRRLAGRVRSAAVRLGVSAIVCAGVVSLCGFLAELAWPFELMCHFRLQYTLVFFGLAFLLALLRDRRWSCIAAVLAAVNGWELLPYYVATPATQLGGEADARLRIVSANLFSANGTPEKAVEFLQRCDADVIVVYEVTDTWERRLSEALPAHPHRRIDSRSGNFGIAVYSRMSIEAAEFHPLSEHNLAIQLDFNHAGRRVHLIAAHSYPPGGERTAIRDRQLARLGDLAQEVAGPLIVVGDLNVTPFSPSFRKLCDQGRLQEARRGHGLLPTWPAGRRFLAIPIDHALTSEHWRSSVSTGGDIGSDHLPLMIDLELNGL